MNSPSIDLKSLKKKIIVRVIVLILFFCLFVLIPAGTFTYWHFYTYAATCFIPMIFTLRYFLKHDPEFLERRMKLKEQERDQRRIISSSLPIYVASFIIPGLDFRFGWSNVPVEYVVIADVMVFLSYIFIVMVFKENKFASRVIQVEQEQCVISTGPYSIVRHPMYVGVIIMYLSTPIALGSYWALIPSVLMPVVMIFRIHNEEKVLREHLTGYQEYCRNVRYRLIPYIW